MSDIAMWVKRARGGRFVGTERIPVPLGLWMFILVASVCGGMTIARALLAVQQAVSDRSVTGVAVGLLALAAGPFSINASASSSEAVWVNDDAAASVEQKASTARSA